MIVDILILITLWLIVCFLGFAIGFFVGLKIKPKEVLKTPPEPPTEEQKRQIEKTQREIENFYRYDGSSQE